MNGAPSVRGLGRRAANEETVGPTRTGRPPKRHGEEEAQQRGVENHPHGMGLLSLSSFFTPFLSGSSLQGTLRRPAYEGPLLGEERPPTRAGPPTPSNATFFRGPIVATREGPGSLFHATATHCIVDTDAPFVPRLPSPAGLQSRGILIRVRKSRRGL